MKLYPVNPVSQQKKPERSAVLLSIHPEFVQKIRDGSKNYELRRQIKPIRSVPEMIVVYETAPTSKIVGFFQCTAIQSAAPDVLWESGVHRFFDTYSFCYGIRAHEFREYFKGANIGYALYISRYVNIDPLALADIGISHAPQNMQFLNQEQWLTIFDRRYDP